MASTADGRAARPRAARPRAGRPTPLALVMASVAIAALFVTPLVYLVTRTVGGDEVLLDLYTSSRTLVPLRNTLLLATATAVSSAVVGTALAWLTTRTDLPLRRLWAGLAPLPLVFPSFVGALALLATVGPGGLVVDGPRPEGFWGAWLVLTLFTAPYVLLPVAARLVALPPSLEESARLLGRSPVETFRTVVLPQVSGAIGAGALLVFLYAMSEFGAVVLLRYDTLTRAIYTNRLLDRDQSAALALLLGTLALVVVAGERMVAGRRPVAAAARGKRPLQVPLGRWRWPALAAVVAWSTLALGAPVAALVRWASKGEAPVADLTDAALNTTWIGLVTAVVAVLVVLPLAYLSSRYPARPAAVANGLVAAGFALPGLVVGFSVVSWAVGLPRSVDVYQTFPLLIGAYVVHLGVQSLRAGQVAVASVPQRLDESARMLGAGRARRLVTVDLPLMLPGLAAGGGLVLLSTMKELPITLLVRPNGFDTLATRIWSGAESGFLAEPAMASLVLVGLSGVLTWFLVVRRTERLA